MADPAAAAEMLEQIKELKASAEVQRKESREADIRVKVAGHKTVGARRSVGLVLSNRPFLTFHLQISHLMKSLHKLDDIDACWAKLAAEAEQGARDVATSDNIARVNKAIVGQISALLDLRKHINHE